jgi:hypothetical protein
LYIVSDFIRSGVDASRARITATRTNNDAVSVASQGPHNGKSRKLYRTARVQNAVLRRRDHAVEIYDQNASSFRDGIGACGPDFEIVVRRFGIAFKLTSVQFLAASVPTGGRRSSGEFRQAARAGSGHRRAPRLHLPDRRRSAGFLARYESFRRGIFPNIAPVAPVPTENSSFEAKLLAVQRRAF